MNEPTFPAATPSRIPHPRNCACLPCIDDLLADVARPLAESAPLVDPALLVPPPRRPDWPGLNRGTRGPQRGAGRRPSGPGRGRGSGSGGSEGRPGGCAMVLTAVGVYVVGALVLLGLAAWLLPH